MISNAWFVDPSSAALSIMLTVWVWQVAVDKPLCELFAEYPMGDLWEDADMPAVVRYLRGSKGLVIPPEWRPFLPANLSDNLWPRIILVCSILCLLDQYKFPIITYADSQRELLVVLEHVTHTIQFLQYRHWNNDRPYFLLTYLTFMPALGCCITTMTHEPKLILNCFCLSLYLIWLWAMNDTWQISSCWLDMMHHQSHRNMYLVLALIRKTFRIHWNNMCLMPLACSSTASDIFLSSWKLCFYVHVICQWGIPN